MNRELVRLGWAWWFRKYTKEGHGLLGVMHVAGAVLQPEDVPGLGDMGDQRIVAGVLPVMRLHFLRSGQGRASALGMVPAPTGVGEGAPASMALAFSLPLA